jgi:phosphomannomutase/phosphoglucomutase
MTLELGTNGVRALFDELNGSSALDIAFGFGMFVKQNTKKEKPKIALAQDMRLTSPCIFSASAAGLMESGCDVLDFGICPSPVAEFGLDRYKADGLIIVTASHNPPEWNALKFVDWNKIPISQERGKKIIAYLSKEHKPKLDYTKIGKVYDYKNILNDYKLEVLKFVNLKLDKKLKMIVDVGNGTSTLILPQILKEIGLEVKVINEELDGKFPSRPSEPNEKNLSKLIEIVKKENADCGVGLDGDADRITFVDEKGRWIIGDKVLAICALYLLKNSSELKDKVLITTYATSKVVQAVGEKFGLKTIYCDIGAPYLAQKIYENKNNCLIAGEEVGGVVFPKFSIAKDGILTAALLPKILLEQKLSKWVDELPNFYNAKIKIEANEKIKIKLVEKLFKELKNEYKDCEIVKLKNGFRIDFKNDSWVLVRSSGTENYIRIFAEAKTQKEADELSTKFKQRLAYLM